MYFSAFPDWQFLVLLGSLGKTLFAWLPLVLFFWPLYEEATKQYLQRLGCRGKDISLYGQVLSCVQALQEAPVKLRCALTWLPPTSLFYFTLVYSMIKDAWFETNSGPQTPFGLSCGWDVVHPFHVQAPPPQYLHLKITGRRLYCLCSPSNNNDLDTSW